MQEIERQAKMLLVTGFPALAEHDPITYKYAHVPSYDVIGGAEAILEASQAVPWSQRARALGHVLVDGFMQGAACFASNPFLMAYYFSHYPHHQTQPSPPNNDLRAFY